MKFIFAFLFPAFALAHVPVPAGSYTAKPVLADLALLKFTKVPVVYGDAMTGVGYAVITPEMENRLQVAAHQVGRCGSFDSLEGHIKDLKDARSLLEETRYHVRRAMSYSQNRAMRAIQIEPKAPVKQAIAKLSAANVRTWVEWLSKFPTRYYRSKDPNIHVAALVEKLKALQRVSRAPLQVDVISHANLNQKSIRVRLEGKARPQETVVLGAHLDSISSGDVAPGADDNASGSSNLLEVLRVLAAEPRTDRSIEFFWYAGEEGGLLGSSEIAATYKEQKRNVVAVLQLDMTLFPGSGRNVFTFMTDFTSPWLTEYMKALNQAYLGLPVKDDRCGYGCSDHASWFRRGFPTVMPFESTFDASNHNIHSVRDVIDSRSDFEHSVQFSRLALAMALELGNSTQTQPY